MSNRKKINFLFSSFDDNPQFGIIPLPSTKVLHKAYFASIEAKVIASSSKSGAVKAARKVAKLKAAAGKKTGSTKIIGKAR